MAPYVYYAVEGLTDEPLAEKLLRASGLLPAPRALVAHGKPNLDKRLPDLNRSAENLPWLVVRDLDRDDRHLCVPSLRRRLLGHPANEGRCFRLAVRSVEAWLIADYLAFADYFAVSRRLPDQVDQLVDPKQSLTDLCRRSRRRSIREGVPPRPGSGRRVGPEYMSTVRDFAHGHWDPNRARARSPSLDRALRCLVRLTTWPNDQEAG